MPHSERATPDEVQQRIDTAFALLVKGYPLRDIVRYLREKTEWGQTLSQRQVYEYVYKARDELKAIATGEIDRREEFAKAVMRLNLQYAKADRFNDTARAIQAQSALINLLHLSDPKAAMDWQEEATRKGIDPAAMFEQLVNAAAQTQDSETSAHE